MGYTDDEKHNMVRLFYKNNNNASAAREEYARLYPGLNTPSRGTFYFVEKCFRERKNLQRKSRKVITNEEEELNILLYFQENPIESTVNASTYLEKSRKKNLTTLHKYRYHPYKILPVQKLTENQKNLRVEFCREMLDRKTQDNNIFKKVLWSDEATFTTAGIFNRKNTHVWACENPHAIREIPFQGRSSVSVWCGILKNKVIGPLFYEGSLTGQRYLDFLNNEIEILLENLTVQEYNNLIWHQDGAPPHNIAPVTHFLNNKYNLWIGRNGGIRWPANSPDLTPMDSFLWGHLKGQVYKHRSFDLEELKTKIQENIVCLNEEHSEVIYNSIIKMDDDYRKCVTNNGGHIEHL